MTRPHIVRADTLDLQDQDSPSASTHSKLGTQSGFAPHQRAELSHVLEERHSEEQALSEAWNIADNLTDEPEVIERAQEQVAGEDGTYTNGEAAAEGRESEADIDDEMMDRISSSPSIDEGEYISTTNSCSPSVEHLVRDSPWPQRQSSLTPDDISVGSRTFNQSASDLLVCMPSSQVSSSNLLRELREDLSASPTTSSPYSLDASPDDLASTCSLQAQLPLLSMRHRLEGRYEVNENAQHTRQLPWERNANEYWSDTDEFNKRSTTVVRVTSCPSGSSWAGPQYVRSSHPTDQYWYRPPGLYSRIDISNSPSPCHLQPSTSSSSIASLQLEDILLPLYDPLLDSPCSPATSVSSWETITSDQDVSPTHTGRNEDDLIDDGADNLLTFSSKRSVDSDWGGECLHETEEIDFEFVYALHTFVATVEGQANATKGDTMFLLDDSNSYWWLVRLVKDQSIGYLPAEHIETPTERLARLNKHRNIDLSATMLSDNSEKSRNPLLRAVRRKNAKSVRFTAPTYVEASDYEYSDDDEEEGDTDLYGHGAQEQRSQQEGEQHETETTADRRISVEDTSRSASPRRRSFDREQAAMAAAALDNDEEPLQSPKLVDKTEAAPLKSRKGTPRHTDSFLKDDSVTIKKTLTPGLLREDSISTRQGSSDVQRSDSLDKDILGSAASVSPDQSSGKKDGKKEKKERKSGMLSGLFKSKKKDKKAKDDSVEGDAEKASLDVSRESIRASPSSFETDSPTRSLSTSTTDTRSQDVQTPPVSRGGLQPQSNESSLAHTEQVRSTDKAAQEAYSSGLATTQNPETLAAEEPVVQNLIIQPAEQPVVQTHSPISPLAPITNMLKRDDSKSQKPAKAKRSKQRVELDDFDSPTDDSNKDPFQDQEEPIDADEMVDEDRLSDSPVEIMPGSFIQSTEHLPTSTPGHPNDDLRPSTNSLSSSPSLIERPEEQTHEMEKDKQESEDSEVTPTAPRSPSNSHATQGQKSSTKITTGASTNAARNLSTDSATTSSSSIVTPISQSSWSDSSLRTWLDDGSEVKDMMVLVHDTSGVEPVSSDHPLMAGLFTEQRKGVEDMMSQLDGLLTGYLQRKGFTVN